MRVLIGAPAFPPSLGGIERFAEQLATGLAERGDQVTVMTVTPASAPDEYPFEVLRSPGPLAKLRAFRACDVFFQTNVSLKDLWPLLFCRRPWVVSHHGLYPTEGLLGILGRLKLLLARRATLPISVSRFVAERVDPGSVVIGNPYRDDLFRVLDGVVRNRDLVFVGRLVSDKGADVLLDAVARLAPRSRPSLSVVGVGPEEATLRHLVSELGLAGQVEFLGRVEGEDLVRVLNRHRILVVPSIWEEPFGIVALEGLACGCAVVGTSGGGLAEALGPAGVMVPNGDAGALALALEEALTLARSPALTDAVAGHLARHRGEVVIGRYRTALLSASARKRR